jgi:signal peptidase I
MGKSSRRKCAAHIAVTRATRASRASLAVRSRAFIMSVLPVLAIFLGTRQLLAEAFRIPSGSMEPALLVGDWLFVNKLRFGISWSRIGTCRDTPAPRVAMSPYSSRRRRM